ncbi:RNA polymerase sigma factor [Sphingobacterium yanglingense]|uniref:RNA polymerase sigma-70 factor (ECF subfamily) n=1 Tax=Sphingobacterium yanglingense TaxID=1437280 RepID=A0A4R6WRN1_9SPHI|nr:sigma-70 family RNA polymerase sigma factor [Sphingobacterium yanglingense]TDQ79296.1 RNA polymerase sigma-70 factor (ECF subfamily) [Sphingobacterium yanglingense]
MDEKDLLFRLQAGDHDAFEKLYQSYAAKLTAKLVTLLRDKDLAGDILQDLFVKVWQLRADIDPDKSFGGYLHTIATNMAKDKFRNSLHQQLYIQSRTDLTEGYDSVSRFMDQKDMRAAVDAALSKLPPRQREVYTLYKIEGLSYKEIQQRLGISKQAVNRLIQEAGKKMREYLLPIGYLMLCSVMVEQLIR